MGREAGHAYEDYRKGAAGPTPLESVLSSRSRRDWQLVPLHYDPHLPPQALLLGSGGGTGQSWRVPGGAGLSGRWTTWWAGFRVPSLTRAKSRPDDCASEAGSARHTSGAHSVPSRPEISQSAQYKISLLLTFYKKSCLLVGHEDSICRARNCAQLRLVAESWCWPGGGVRQEDPVPAPGLGHVLGATDLGRRSWRAAPPGVGSAVLSRTLGPGG